MKSGNFSHTHSSTFHKKSRHIEWDYFSNENHSSFYIDGDFERGLSEKNDGKRKFLWGLESRHFNQSFHSRLQENLSEILEVYDYIFTYDEDLLALDKRFKWVPAMGSWINKPGIRKKDKFCSMVVSEKTLTPQQKFRVNFASRHSEKIDLFGGLVRKIDYKEEALDRYMFSVAIENDTCDTYFTEKILDCFATGCIPIYLGTSKVSEFFDGDGIIFIEDENLPEISIDLYMSKREAVLNNLEKVLSFNTIEDWMFQNYKDILE
jgi:hypothetical protein